MKMSTLLSLFTLFISFSAFAQNGLKADYYDGTNFDRFVGTKIETNIDYYWNETAPFQNMNPNECSVRWTGRLKAPATGEFTFSARVDDGIRVWVGNVQIIDNWQLNDVGYSKGNIKMEKGVYYDLKVEYFNALHEAEIKFLWTLPKPENLSWYENFWYDDKGKIVPAKYFFQPIEQKLAEVPNEKKNRPKPKKPTPPKPKKNTPKKQLIIPKESKTTAEITIEQYLPKNVQFERTKTEILPESFPELDKLAAFLTKNPTHKIKIEGHTDNVGNAEKNLKLSHSRARAVAAYLIKKGVHYERLSAEGFGGSRPLVKSEGGKYHPENRRVEFIVQ